MKQDRIFLQGVRDTWDLHFKHSDTEHIFILGLMNGL